MVTGPVGDAEQGLEIRVLARRVRRAWLTSEDVMVKDDLGTEERRIPRRLVLRAEDKKRHARGRACDDAREPPGRGAMDGPEDEVAPPALLPRAALGSLL